MGEDFSQRFEKAGRAAEAEWLWKSSIEKDDGVAALLLLVREVVENRRTQNGQRLILKQWKSKKLLLKFWCAFNKTLCETNASENLNFLS